jgi:hypothetical protein
MSAIYSLNPAIRAIRPVRSEFIFGIIFFNIGHNGQPYELQPGQYSKIIKFTNGPNFAYLEIQGSGGWGVHSYDYIIRFKNQYRKWQIRAPNTETLKLPLPKLLLDPFEPYEIEIMLTLTQSSSREFVPKYLIKLTEVKLA